MRRLHLPLAVAVAFICSSAPTVFTQGGAAVQQPATGRGQAPPARQWWVNKDKPGQFGKNKVHQAGRLEGAPQGPGELDRGRCR